MDNNYDASYDMYDAADAVPTFEPSVSPLPDTPPQLDASRSPVSVSVFQPASSCSPENEGASSESEEVHSLTEEEFFELEATSSGVENKSVAFIRSIFAADRRVSTAVASRSLIITNGNVEQAVELLRSHLNAAQAKSSPAAAPPKLRRHSSPSGSASLLPSTSLPRSPSSSLSDHRASSSSDRASVPLAQQCCSPSQPRGMKRDWGLEYIHLLSKLRNPDLPEADRYAFYKQLDGLATEFAITAKLYGKTIISELNLPAEERTIQELQGQGYAGGFKYCVGKIFYKFPMDGKQIMTPNGLVHVFSASSAPDHSLSMKTANAELRGNIALHRVFTRLNTSNDILVVLPLMVVIVYRGYRLVASSYFDIGRDTLVHGCADVGDIKGDVKLPPVDMNFSPLWTQACRELGIGAEHEIFSHQRDPLTGRSLLQIVGPLDLEVHKLRSPPNTYVVVDPTRLFPPAGRDERLFSFLRPELIKRFLNPHTLEPQLSPDTFFKMQMPCRDAVDNINNLVGRIGATAVQFIRNFTSKARTSDLKARLINLPLELHRFGINLRYMPAIFDHALLQQSASSSSSSSAGDHHEAGSRSDFLSASSAGLPSQFSDSPYHLLGQQSSSQISSVENSALLRTLLAEEILARAIKNHLHREFLQLSFLSSVNRQELHEPFLRLACGVFNLIVKCKLHRPQPLLSLNVKKQDAFNSFLRGLTLSLARFKWRFEQPQPAALPAGIVVSKPAAKSRLGSSLPVHSQSSPALIIKPGDSPTVPQSATFHSSQSTTNQPSSSSSQSSPLSLSLSGSLSPSKSGSPNRDQIGGELTCSSDATTSAVVRAEVIKKFPALAETPATEPLANSSMFSKLRSSFRKVLYPPDPATAEEQLKAASPSRPLPSSAPIEHLAMPMPASVPFRQLKQSVGAPSLSSSSSSSSSSPRQQIKCPQGHSCALVVCSGNWFCDCCFRQFKSSSNQHSRCHTCDFDICQSCEAVQLSEFSGNSSLLPHTGSPSSSLSSLLPPGSPTPGVGSSDADQPPIDNALLGCLEALLDEVELAPLLTRVQEMTGIGCKGGSSSLNFDTPGARILRSDLKMQVLVKQLNFVNAARGKIYLRKAIRAYSRGVGRQQVQLLAHKALRRFETLPTIGPEELTVIRAAGDTNFLLAMLETDYGAKVSLLESARNIYDSVGTADRGLSLLHHSECCRWLGIFAAIEGAATDAVSNHYKEAANYLFLALTNCTPSPPTPSPLLPVDSASPSSQQQAAFVKAIHVLYTSSELPVESQYRSCIVTGGENLLSLLTIVSSVALNPSSEVFFPMASAFSRYFHNLLTNLTYLRLSHCKTAVSGQTFEMLLSIDTQPFFKSLELARCVCQGGASFWSSLVSQAGHCFSQILKLDLSYTSVPDAALADLLVSARCLNELILDGCLQLTCDGLVGAFAQFSTSEPPHLLSLSLRHLRQINDTAAETIGASYYCKRLARLVLDGCNIVDTNFLFHLGHIQQISICRLPIAANATTLRQMHKLHAQLTRTIIVEDITARNSTSTASFFDFQSSSSSDNIAADRKLRKHHSTLRHSFLPDD